MEHYADYWEADGSDRLEYVYDDRDLDSNNAVGLN